MSFDDDFGGDDDNNDRKKDKRGGRGRERDHQEFGGGDTGGFGGGGGVGGGGGGGGASTRVTRILRSCSTSAFGATAGISSNISAARCSAMTNAMPMMRGQLSPLSSDSS